MPKTHGSLIAKSYNNEYKMTIRKTQQDWAGIVAEKLGTDLRIDPEVCTEKEFRGRLYITQKKSGIIQNILDSLRKSGKITDYEIEDGTGEIVTIFVRAGKPKVCYRILDKDFKFTKPIFVSGSKEVYWFQGDDEFKSNRLAYSLGESLAKAQILVEEMIKDPKPITEFISDITPSIRFDDDAKNVIELLIKEHYFDADKKREITQQEIGDKLGISAGKINKIIHHIQHVGFTNLLSLHPDLGKFNTILNRVMEKEKFKVNQN